MVTLEQLALAALARDHLRLRSLTQDLLREQKTLTHLSSPATADAQVLSVAAGLVELLALRRHEPAPSWVEVVGPLKEPFYMLEAAQHFKRLRLLCETESPEPLRRRNLLAPPDFLTFA